MRVCAGQRVQRGADQARVGQPGLADQGTYRVGRRGVLRQAGQVQAQDATAREGERRRGQGGAGTALVLAQVGQGEPVGEDPGQRSGVSDALHRVPGRQEIGETRIPGVVAQQVGGDPVRDAQRPAQERAVQVLGQEQPGMAEWRAGGQPAPRLRIGR